MPYIKKADREQIAPVLDALLAEINCVTPAGELNYIITRIMHKAHNATINGYARYNEIIGALECAKLELYRRKIVPYENKKIKENGDVS